jgi:hypothetical protein
MPYPEFHHIGFKLISCYFMFKSIVYMGINLRFKIENQKKLDEIKDLLQTRDKRQ